MVRLLLLVASSLCSPVFAADKSSDSEPHVAPVPAGTVCQNATGLTEPPIRRLRGRHIVACGPAYAPFLLHYHDANGHAVWEGLDVDLLVNIAAILEFNFTILPIAAYVPGEPWDDILDRMIWEGECDLVLTWWAHNANRSNRMRLLNGHYDTSVYLKTRPPEIVSDGAYKKAFSFAEPFTAEGWLSIIVVLTVGALFMRYLESEDGTVLEEITTVLRSRLGSLTAVDAEVMQEAMQGAPRAMQEALQGAPGAMQEAMQEAPGAMQRSMRNRGREVKQEARLAYNATGFAYDATGHALYSAAAGALWGDHEPPRTRRGSIALLGYGFVVLVLVAAYTANLATYMSRRNIHVLPISSMDDLTGSDAPSVCVLPAFLAVYPAFNRLHPGLKYEPTSDPAGTLLNGGCDAYLTYQHPEEQASPSTCWLHTIGQAIFPNEAGWVTPFRSDCIAHSIELALLALQMHGVTEELFSRWMPPPQTCDYLPKTARRRLRGSSGGSAGAVADISSSFSDGGVGVAVTALGFEDLAGLFILYLGLLVVLAASKIIEGSQLYKRGFGCRRKKGSMVRRSPGHAGIRRLPASPSVAPGLRT